MKRDNDHILCECGSIVLKKPILLPGYFVLRCMNTGYAIRLEWKQKRGIGRVIDKALHYHKV